MFERLQAVAIAVSIVGTAGYALYRQRNIPGRLARIQLYGSWIAFVLGSFVPLAYGIARNERTLTDHPEGRMWVIYLMGGLALIGLALGTIAKKSIPLWQKAMTAILGAAAVADAFLPGTPFPIMVMILIRTFAVSAYDELQRRESVPA